MRETPRSVAPSHLAVEPKIVVMTPGPHDGAYFEHAFLADQRGAELVEVRDRIVADGALHRKTTRGVSRVDVLYRRIADDKALYVSMPEIIEFYTGR